MDLVLRGLERRLVRHPGEHQQRPQPAVLPEEDVGVETVADHADLILANVKLVRDVVEHERRGLTHHRRLPLGGALDRAHHAPVTGPLLRVSQVGHRVGVGRDELAPRVLADAQRGVLDLVVVDVAIEADDDCGDVRVVLHELAGGKGHLLVAIRLAAQVRNAHAVEFLQDASLANDVHLLVLGEVDGLEVRGGGEGGGKDLLGGDLEPQAEELLEVARAGLGGVVGDEDEPLAHLAEHGDGLGDALDEGVALPDDAVAVEDERLDGINQALLVAVLELVHLGLDRHGADGAGRVAAGGTQGSASESGLGGDARDGRGGGGAEREGH
mmetsp:Transcript_8310/g.36764  ORF Transcript_8310/g.36764 Transcript_8310/m.36764 type:complete len:327 (-) Transcript_8310:103-1083(-)